MQNSDIPEIPEQDPEQSKKMGGGYVDQDRQATRDDASDILNPVDVKLRELARRRESGEINPYDYDWEQLFQFEGVPLRRVDLGDQALVLTCENLVELGALEIVLASGHREFIETESLAQGDVLIIYPDDLS